MRSAKTRKSSPPEPAPALISPALAVETVDIASLSPDPANARLHNAKNIEAIKASLRRFGQQKPIVVDRSNVVRAGNGTLAAALALGWKQISIVRSELAGSEMTAYAIADNRTAELAEWDDDALAAELGSLKEDGIDLADMGFDEKELDRLLGESPGDDDAGDVEQLGDEKFMVLVTCKSEAEQAELLERFAGEGLECKALSQ